jgi:hypothetical protein
MNIGKLIFVVLALSLTGTATWIYFNQRDSHLARVLVNSPIKAQLIGFEMNRYRDDQWMSRIASRKATLMENGKLVFDTKARASRMRGGKIEELEADSAIIQLLNDPARPQMNSTIVTAELSGSVELLKGESRFTTEWLLYTESTSEAFTDRAVRIDSNEEFVAAEGGMTYNIREESIRLRGGVFGSVRPDAAAASMKGKKKND